MRPQTTIKEETLNGITVKAAHTNGLRDTYFIIDVLSPLSGGCRSLKTITTKNEEIAGITFRSLVKQIEAGITFWDLKFGVY
jgi:hypothetical protein